MLLKKNLSMILSWKRKKQKNSGIQDLSELDWGYAQFQSYINIKFYYRYFFP